MTNQTAFDPTPDTTITKRYNGRYVDVTVRKDGEHDAQAVASGVAMSTVQLREDAALLNAAADELDRMNGKKADIPSWIKDLADLAEPMIGAKRVREIVGLMGKL